jgi:hypothetical protein
MKSVYEAVKSVVSLVPAVRTADANGTAVDTKGYNSAKAVICAGDIDLSDADETYALKVQECETSGGTFTDVSGATGAVTADNDVVEIPVERLGTTRKRYLRVVLDVGGTTPSIPCSAVFELGNAYQKSVQS